MEPKRDSYDVVVIGAGMGGLTAAATLARKSLKVLLVDKNERPGGYAQSMEREGFIFDLAVHLICGCDEGGTVRSVLEDLRVQDEIEFIKPDVFYRCIFPDFTLDIPNGLKQFTEAHVRRFPHEKQGIEALVSTMKDVYNDAIRIPPSMGLIDLLKTPFIYPHLFKYRNKTFAQMLDDFIKDKRLKATLSALWGYIGLSPSRLPATFMSTAIVALVGDNEYYVRGGFQQLVNALVHGLQKHGGEVMLETKVDRIHCENNKVSSVQLEGGIRVKAKVVVSNVSAKQTFGKLVSSPSINKKYLERVHRMRPSCSVFEVFVGTDLDLRESVAAHETFAMWSYDLDFDLADNFSHTLDETSGRGAIGICVPTLTDPSVAPEGRHVLCLASFAPYDMEKNWDEEKNNIGERLIKRVETLIPGLNDHAVIKEIVSPLDMERLTLNDQGAPYGWEKSIDQLGPKALTFSTPFEGLYLAGHWTGLEHGVPGTMGSGKRVSDVIVRAIC